MIQIVPVKEKKLSANDIYYIENTEQLDSIAKKYNYAIENICLPSNEQYFCFRHNDLSFNTPNDIMKYKLDHLFMDNLTNVGVAGLIGTYLLENSCVWWNPNRIINAAGSIIQGYKDGKTAPMNDWPGLHHGLASVDGCCLFISRKMLESGIRFDESLPTMHFYDADICCQALMNHFDIATIDIVATHTSVGELPSDFAQQAEIFRSKWTNLIDNWPISKYTKFKTT